MGAGRGIGVAAIGLLTCAAIAAAILSNQAADAPPAPTLPATSALFRLTPPDGWHPVLPGTDIPRDRDPDINARGAVAFAADRSGQFQIWVGEPGKVPTPVTSFDGPVAGSPRWAPDGRRIAFTLSAEGATTLMILDYASGHLRPVASDPGSVDRAPAWSRDGQRLYFASNRLGGWRIWISRPPYEEAMPIADAGWLSAKESADGRWLYLVREGEGGLWRQPADGGNAEQVALVPSAANSESWLPTRNGVLILDRPAGESPHLLLLPADGGALRVVAPAPGAVANSGLALDRDGQPVIAADHP